MSFQSVDEIIQHYKKEDKKMKYQTVKPIIYDWIKIPVDTIVTKSEEWREHEKFKYIAMFVMPDGITCPLFFDEVVEVAKCKFCNGDGLSYTGVEHSGMHRTEHCQGCEGIGWRKLEVISCAT